MTIHGIKIIVNKNGNKQFGILSSLIDNRLQDINEIPDRSFFYFYKNDFDKYIKDKYILQELLLKTCISEEDILKRDNILKKIKNAKIDYDKNCEAIIEQQEFEKKIDPILTKIINLFENNNKEHSDMLSLLERLQICEIDISEYPKTLVDYFNLFKNSIEPKFVEGCGNRYINMLIQKFNPDNEYDALLVSKDCESLFYKDKKIDISTGVEFGLNKIILLKNLTKN